MTWCLGNSLEAEMAIEQWLEYRVTQVDRCSHEKEVTVVLQVCYYLIIMIIMDITTNECTHSGFT